MKQPTRAQRASKSLKNRAVEAAQKKAPATGGKTLEQRIRALNRYRETLNPLKGLTIQKAIGYLEQYQRGEYADPMWLLYFIEQTDADLFALIQRRTSSICALDWDIKIVETADATPETKQLAEKQQKHLRQCYDRIKNLTKCFSALELSVVRGFAIVQKQIRDASGASVPARTGANHLEVIDPWRIMRDGMRGAFHYNADAKPRSSYNLTDENKLDPQLDALIIRESDQSLYRIAMLKFVRANLSEKDWDSFIEIYGIPACIIIGPQNVPVEKEAQYREAAEQAAEGGSGYIPNGSDAKFPPVGSQPPPFKDRLDHLSEKLILAGTGGMLSMLAKPTGIGSGPTDAHVDTFTEIARTSARDISQLFNQYVDRPELDEAFPNEPRLAYFELAAKDKVDVNAVVDHAAKLRAAGKQIDHAQLEELTGYTLTDAPMPAQPTATPPAEVPPLFNRAGAQEVLAGFAAAISKAASADLEPLKARVAAVLKITDDKQFVEALNALRADLPMMVGNADALAVALEGAMSAAFANGIEEAAGGLR